METQDFESRLTVLKQHQLDILKIPTDTDALAILLRKNKLDVHGILCDMAKSDLLETGRIANATRQRVEENRTWLTRLGAEAIAVEIEAAVLRECGPEEE